MVKFIRSLIGQFNRSAEELIVLSVGAVCLFGLVPFSIMRLVRGDWQVGLIDLVGVVTTSLMLIYVYHTRRYEFASLLLVITSIVGISTVIWFNGPSELHFFFPVLMAAYFLVSPNVAVIISLLAMSALAPRLVSQMGFFEYLKFAVSVAGSVLFAYAFATIRNRQRDALLLVSNRDPLTGAGNRRALNQKLSEMLQIYQRSKTNCSLLLLDLDNFKRVNDRDGHVVGDGILVRVTETIQSRIRITDKLYRYGGDEFVVLAANCDLETAEGLAEDIRSLVETNEALRGSMVSISLGIAQYLEGQTTDQWLISADQALFEAKRAGRNQAVTSHPTKQI